MSAVGHVNRDPFKVCIIPSANPKYAALFLHNFTMSLMPFFQREEPVTIAIDLLGDQPGIHEVTP